MKRPYATLRKSQTTNHLLSVVERGTLEPKTLLALRATTIDVLFEKQDVKTTPA